MSRRLLCVMFEFEPLYKKRKRKKLGEKGKKIFMYLFIYLLFYFIYLFIYLSIYYCILFIYLFIYLFFASVWRHFWPACAYAWARMVRSG